MNKLLVAFEWRWRDRFPCARTSIQVIEMGSMIIKNNRPYLYYQLEQFNVKGYHLPIESFQTF
ncbi:hypothetical protein DNK49_06425 [Azoarcus communis]|uniref:Uncharacterized protein n=1 Tax=Parazoarcus communis SWub3 = DSM 12120 TaxID=1121029 RepID=A0A323UZ35_9RHOO|nr:hypothetical protein DNK49_06425 [Azoarcus communis] [Parazoarcus communis SWub3 = DSM 12120]